MLVLAKTEKVRPAFALNVFDCWHRLLCKVPPSALKAKCNSFSWKTADACRFQKGQTFLIKHNKPNTPVFFSGRATPQCPLLSSNHWRPLGLIGVQMENTVCCCTVFTIKYKFPAVTLILYLGIMINHSGEKSTQNP